MVGERRPLALGEAASRSLRGLLSSVHAPKQETDPARCTEMRASILKAFDDLRTMAPVMPPPRLVKTTMAAEAYAAEVMRALGFRDARVTPPGNDGGIDVVSDRGIAQVKMEGLPTGRPALQALTGAALIDGKIGSPD